MVSLNLAARIARRQLWRTNAQRHYADIPMAEMPIFFGNSFPKSGTHLLTQILAGFSKLGPVTQSGLPPVLTYEGESGRQRLLKSILADLYRFLPGDIGYGHLHAIPEVVNALCRERVAPFFIYRDPRDVIVSHVFYVTDINSNHVHHEYYVNQLESFDQRLEVSILGRPELEIPFPDVYARFEPYLGWLDQPEVLTLRYEDLLADTQAQLGKIFDHAVARGFVTHSTREQALATLTSAIKPEESPTFRKGTSGGWKKHFTTAHTHLFKEVSGDLLIRLGYEKDQNW